MSGLWKSVKSALVKSDEDDAPLAPLPPLVARAPVATAPTFTPDSDLVLPEGVELATIYAEAGVPPAPFPIEKLAKVVEGLNQLDAATKKIVVASMDDADDTWTIEDVLRDARAKGAALSAYLTDIAELDVELNREVASRIEKAQAKRQATVDDLEAQIASLQAKREEAMTSAATDIAQLRAQGASASEAADRERQRITSSIKANDALVALFNTTPAPAGASS